MPKNRERPIPSIGGIDADYLMCGVKVFQGTYFDPDLAHIPPIERALLFQSKELKLYEPVPERYRKKPE